MQAQSHLNKSRQPIEQIINGLLAHLDAQEASMLAFRSLLADLAKHSLSTTEQRKLRTRLEASQQLAQKLEADRVHLVQEAANALGIPVEYVCLSQLDRMAPENMRERISGAKRRINRLAVQLGRQSSTVNWTMSEERNINYMMYQGATGNIDSDRYDAKGQRMIHPASLRYQDRS